MNFQTQSVGKFKEKLTKEEARAVQNAIGETMRKPLYVFWKDITNPGAEQNRSEKQRAAIAE